jgi:hypothetical protein
MEFVASMNCRDAERASPVSSQTRQEKIRKGDKAGYQSHSSGICIHKEKGPAVMNGRPAGQRQMLMDIIGYSLLFALARQGWEISQQGVNSLSGALSFGTFP